MKRIAIDGAIVMVTETSMTLDQDAIKMRLHPS
jgi:hypothetical protein